MYLYLTIYHNLFARLSRITSRTSIQKELLSQKKAVEADINVLKV